MRLPAVLLLAVVLVVAAATADHAWKTHRANDAERREWYCAHAGTRCGGPSSASIERHWNQRELVYELVGAGLLTAAATVAVHRLDRRWRRS